MHLAILFIFGLCCQSWSHSLNANAELTRTTQRDPDKASTLRSVVYFVNWAIYGRNHNPQDLPADHITHVLYAFADIDSESGEVLLSDPFADIGNRYPSDSKSSGTAETCLYGCLKQLFLLKKRYRKLKVMLSIGGWKFSPNFIKPASTHKGRVKFADSAVRLVQDLGLDGLDIDWEFPANDAQAGDHIALLKETRKALDLYSIQRGNNEKFLLSAACPAAPFYYKTMHIKDMSQHLDFLNLMGYDFSGASDSEKAGHQANIFRSKSNPASTPFSVDEAVSYYTSVGGIARSKLVIGMPLYGRAFENTKGPGTSFKGVGGGSWPNEDGIWSYNELPKRNTSEPFVMDAIASYSYDFEKKVMVSYDNSRSTTAKAGYIKEGRLGGGMWWESSRDKAGDRSLIKTLVTRFGGPGSSELDQSVNVLNYSSSIYANVKSGFVDE